MQANFRIITIFQSRSRRGDWILTSVLGGGATRTASSIQEGETDKEEVTILVLCIPAREGMHPLQLFCIRAVCAVELTQRCKVIEHMPK